MYKVFIENNVKTYQLNSEKELLEEFNDHKFIEAAGGIVEKDEKYLFIKRHDLWDIPKGKLEKGEDVEAGAVREIEEECGLVGPKIIEHLVNTWHTYEFKGKKVLKKTFWFHLESNEMNENLVPQLEESITEVKYFEQKEFKTILSNTYDSIKDVIVALENKLA